MGGCGWSVYDGYIRAIRRVEMGLNTVCLSGRQDVV